MSAANEQTNLHNEQLLQEIKSLEKILQLKNVQLNSAIKNIEQNFANMHGNYRNMSNDLHNSWKYKYNQLYKQNNEIKLLIEQLNIQQNKSNKQTQIKNGKTTADKQTELTDQNLQQINPKNVIISKNNHIDNKEHKSNTDQIKSTPKTQKNITKKKGKKKSKKSNKQKQNKSEINIVNTNINENESELLKTFELFENKIGNKPDTFMQFFNFIKQENINFKYGQVKKWWENNHNVSQKSVTKTKTKTCAETINKPPIIKRSRSKRRNGNLLLYNRNKFIKTLNNELKVYQFIISNYSNEIFMEKNEKFISKLTSKYAFFLNKLLKLKQEKKINEYLQTNGNSLHYDIQLLWRIHLINPNLYTKHCDSLFGFVLSPKYEYIKFMEQNDIKSKSQRNKQKKKPLLIKKILNTIDFGNEIKSYLVFMNKIVKLYENESVNKDLIIEYESYIRFLKEVVFVDGDEQRYIENYNDKINDRILDLSKFVPGLNKAFLWYTHILFPKIFSNEIDHKMINQFEIYEYKFMNLNYIIIQNKKKVDVIWIKIKDENVGIKEKHKMLMNVYTQQNNELLVYGFIENIIECFNSDDDDDGEYIVPLVIVDKIINFYEEECVDRVVNKLCSNKDVYKRCGVSMIRMKKIRLRRRKCF